VTRTLSKQLCRDADTPGGFLFPQSSSDDEMKDADADHDFDHNTLANFIAAFTLDLMMENLHESIHSAIAHVVGNPNTWEEMLSMVIAYCVE